MPQRSNRVIDNDTVYLDNNASTPIDSRVLETLTAAHLEFYGNPSNTLHSMGKSAQKALSQARDAIRDLLCANEFQVIFTSGATEALNLAIVGLNPSRVIIGSTEHKAVIETCRWLMHERKVDVYRFLVDTQGRADVGDVQKALHQPTSLVAAMLANNETGAIHPIEEIAGLTRDYRVPLLCDISQAVGKMSVRVGDLGADMVVLSGHKIYGPKGIGALLYHRSLSGKLTPVIHGGGQEFGLRSGTENVPSAVAFAKAIEIGVTEQTTNVQQMKNLRDLFETTLCRLTSGIIINSSDACRLPNTTNISVVGVDIEGIFELIKPLAISTGSACGSQEVAGSHVLRAMGVPDALAANSLRVSFGRQNTSRQSVIAAEIIANAINRVRSDP